MPKLSGKDLGSLYPKPKTLEELETERQIRNDTRRPRFVPEKISLWTTLGIVIVLAAYQLTTYIVAGNLSSTGGVLFSVSFSILIPFIACAVLFYLYSLISTLAGRVLLSTTPLYAALASVIIITALISRYSGGIN